MSTIAETAPLLTIENLKDEIRLQSQKGPNVELPTAAMFGALLESDDRGIDSLLQDTTRRANARGIPGGAIVSALRTTLIDYFRTLSEIDHQVFTDDGMVTPGHWKGPIAMLGDDLQHRKSSAVDLIHAGIYFRVASTPVKERYASMAAMTKLVAERFPAGARGLSIGCSIMAGELQLMHSEEFPMSMRGLALPGKRDATARINKLLEGPSLFSRIVAVDTNILYDEDKQRYDYGNAHYARSGLRPSERNDKKYFDDLAALMAKKERTHARYDPDNGVVFHQGNLIEPAGLAKFTDQFPGTFDVIMMNFLTQELSPAEQIELHKVAERLVSENGLIIYNHQAYIPPERQAQPTDIKHVRHLRSYAHKKYTSAMHYVDMRNPERGVQEAMRFHNNRCRVARVSPLAKLMVNGALEPITDLIANS